MSKINLLPWREQIRARQKKQFAFSLGAAALAGIVATGVLFSYYSQQVSGQESRNAFLEEKIAAAEKKIEQIEDLDAQKQRLIARKNVIDSLQTDRSRIVRLFEALAKSLPDGVVLTLVKQNEQGMLIEGRAQSNARVSTYMRNLEASGWLKNPDLSVIEETTADPGFEKFPYQFRMSVGLASSEELPTVSPVAPVVVPLPTAPEDLGSAPAQPGASVAPGVADPGLPPTAARPVPLEQSAAPPKPLSPVGDVK